MGRRFIDKVLQLLKGTVRLGGKRHGRKTNETVASITRDEALHLMDVLVLCPEDPTGLTDALLRKLNKVAFNTWCIA